MLSLVDQIYIAKWSEKLTIGEIARGFNLNIKSIEKEIARQKQEGVFEKYKELTDEEYELIFRRENFRKKIKWK